MSELTLDSERLKTIRKARKLGRSRLAKISGVTERQIGRLEGGAQLSGDAGRTAIARLSDALQVPQGVLMGTLPIQEDDLIPASELCCSSSGCGCG